MLHTALAVAAALVSLAFAMSTFERWLVRRRRHELAWSAALAMFSLASAALAAGGALGWSPATFRVFYLFGAITNVPFLALGTVYLLGGRRLGDAWAVAVCLFAAFAAGVVWVAPLTAPLPRHELARGSEVFAALPRVLAAVASSVGALVVVAGAVWSAARGRDRRLVVANALIALGTVVTGASGLFNAVLDEMTAFAVALVVGISVIFAGFLVATAARPPGRSAPEKEELHEGGAEDEHQQQGEHDGGAPSHAGASRLTASPGPSPSSSAAERRSSATETIP
ncbi:MAG: hypothetical protein M3N68_13535 [Actinomycetota bacterium]|nr:hypothetical protein [Actinomycetota bacterium]